MWKQIWARLRETSIFKKKKQVEEGVAGLAATEFMGCGVESPDTVKDRIEVGCSEKTYTIPPASNTKDHTIVIEQSIYNAGANSAKPQWPKPLKPPHAPDPIQKHKVRGPLTKAEAEITAKRFVEEKLKADANVHLSRPVANQASKVHSFATRFVEEFNITRGATEYVVEPSRKPSASRMACGCYAGVQAGEEPMVSWQEELRRSEAKKRREREREWVREVMENERRGKVRVRKAQLEYKWVEDGDEPIAEVEERKLKKYKSGMKFGINNL